MIVENDHLIIINEANKLTMHEPQRQNVLFCSELHQWYAPDAFKSFSVKFVRKGTINYRFGSTLYPVKQSRVLIGNSQPGVEAFFTSKETVKSMCMQLNMDTIAEAHALLSAKGDLDLDNLMDRHFTHPGLGARIFNITHQDFMAPLRYIAMELDGGFGPKMLLNQEFFLDMSERLVLELFKTCQAYDNLDFVRASTKKEVLRRLDIARNHLEETYMERPTVKDLAVMCNLSEFHFFRAFRQAYGITPYQFQLQLRLEKARRLITHSTHSLTRISRECAFPDLASFSKAYKRMYRVAPSVLRSF
jgi:AraC family transcriptional regulator